MKRILIVKLWALGDILMATPLLTALKRQWPDCQITWLADKDYAGILEDNPLLEEVAAFDSGKWRRHWRYGQFFAYVQMTRTLRRDLRRKKFDIVISLTGEKWWSIWFLVAPIRIGLFPRPVPGRMGCLYHHAIPRNDSPIVHNSTHYLRPAGILGILGPYDERLVLSVSERHNEDTGVFLSEHLGGYPAKPLLVLHPGTSQDSKCWPARSFAALASACSRRFDIVITGSASERKLAESVAAAMPEGSPAPIIAAGELKEIGQTAALVARAAAVVTGDTSMLHIASALGTPFVGIYGSTRPNDNAPRFGSSILLFDDSVPCSPCYKAHCPLHGEAFMQCQQAVSPEQVIEAINTLMKETDESSHTPSFSDRS